MEYSQRAPAYGDASCVPLMRQHPGTICDKSNSLSRSALRLVPHAAAELPNVIEVPGLKNKNTA